MKKSRMLKLIIKTSNRIVRIVFDICKILHLVMKIMIIVIYCVIYYRIILDWKKYPLHYN